MGNHERMLLDFLDDPAAGPEWFALGGQATLLSYGVGFDADDDTTDPFSAAAAALRRALPAGHITFLRALRPAWEIGGYFFTHAGVRPGVPLAAQKPADLMWIRDEFRRSRADHGKVIVHGHSAIPQPEVRHNRIGIDTGAYASGRLTCLVLEGACRRFLTAGRQAAG
jgi:serine/threonine protein phosphatase 1